MCNHDRIDRLRRCCATAAVFAACSLADAANITWIGLNNNWVDGAANNANWNPATEPGSGDVAIFNTSHTVNLGSANSVAALNLSGGIDLNTNGFNLTVGGLVQLSGSSTNLIVTGATSTLATQNVTIGSSGQLEMAGGNLSVLQVGTLANGVLTVSSGGTLSGNGTITLDSPSSPTTVLNNGGAITALSRPSNVLLPPPVGTLLISGGAQARIDLDGSSENGIVNVNRNQTLDIRIALADTFNGQLNLFHNSALQMQSAWSLGPAGNITVNNGAVIAFPSIPADIATIGGATFTQSGGSINVATSDSTLRFDAPFTMSAGSLVNNGLVVFNANATIGSGANFTMPTSDSSMTVEAGRTVTFNQANFNPDGGGQTTNIITVNSGGALVLNLGLGADESLSGLIQLNGGGLNVTTASDTWSIDGTLQVGANTGVSQLSGETLTIANANVTVGNGSTLRVAAPVNLGSGGIIAGTGVLAFNNQVNVVASRTLNLVGGTVDLDGTDAVGDQINVRAPFVINAAVMESFGRNNAGGGVNALVIDALSPGATGSMTVTLDDPNAEWTLNPQGSLALVSTNAPLTLLSGNPVNLNGSVTVTGTAGTAARVKIGGTVNIQTASPNGGLLLQGGTIAAPNKLEGGQINGPGALQAISGRALEGFGTINAPVKFSGTAELIASGGLLNVTGGIDDVGTVRVKDASTLNLAQPLLTVITDNGIVMEGGVLQGLDITTSSTDAANRSLRGFGTVSNPVVNNGIIQAIGGTLQLTNTSSDWDGAGTGHLRASGGGLLQLQGNGSFPFGGSVIAVENSKVLTNGFGLNMSSTSSLQLTQGTYESTASIKVGGDLIAGAGAPSTIKVALNSFLEIEPTATVLLNGDLQLESNNAIVRAGAAFGGNGALVVPPGPNNLVLAPSANVNALVINQGAVHPGGFVAAGRSDLRDYQQQAGGKFVADLAGPGLNQFDRLIVNGIAQLEGKLELTRLGGYVPQYMASHQIITALGRNGVFDQVDGVEVAPNRYLAVTYTPTSVLVTAALPGDANLDGTVNISDFSIVASNFNTTGRTWAGGSFDGNSIVNIGDFALLAAHFNLSVPVDLPRGTSVPEPTGLAALALAAALATRRRRR